jgi:hypothetical protein
VFLFVLGNIGINIRIAVQNWPTLSLSSLAISTGLWMILPLIAVILLWCGEGIGRWLLVGLFGFRAAGESLGLGLLVAGHWDLLFKAPYLSQTLAALYYFTAAGWMCLFLHVRRSDYVRVNPPPTDNNDK